MNRKKTSGGKSPVTLNHLLAVALVVVIFYLFKKTNFKKSPAPRSTEPREELSQGNMAVVNPPEVVDKAKEEADFYAQRALWARESAVGLVSVPGEAVGGKIRLNFKFKPKKQWCRAGDLDTMKYAVLDVTTPDILISLESLDGRTRETFYASLYQLMQGVERKFEVDPSGSSNSYGIFICLDLKKEKSCRKKVVIPQSEMGPRIIKDQAEANYVPKDYLFYFQHLIVANNAFQAYASNDFRPEFRKKVQALLKEKYDMSTSDFDVAWKISNVTRSLPSRIEGKDLLLELPVNDPRCTSPAK
ncbi:MAG: hypothetical protein EOP04_30880 [Proteobacteria bacterium]|nr:MAG: hypothetical protein EOP04_30880 [Pseudomonadota bacterium]